MFNMYLDLDLDLDLKFLNLEYAQAGHVVTEWGTLPRVCGTIHICFS